MRKPVRRGDSSAACGLEESGVGEFQNLPEEEYCPWSLRVRKPVRRGDSSAACGLEESGVGEFQNLPEEEYCLWSLRVRRPGEESGILRRLGGLEEGEEELDEELEKKGSWA